MRRLREVYDLLSGRKAREAEAAATLATKRLDDALREVERRSCPEAALRNISKVLQGKKLNGHRP